MHLEETDMRLIVRVIAGLIVGTACAAIVIAMILILIY